MRLLPSAHSSHPQDKFKTRHKQLIFKFGEVAERLNAPLLKTT
jgi:hypothetical protein